MDIQTIRLQQRQQQQRAIEQRNSGLYRIGDRDSTTGRTELIYPDGSRNGNGIKLYGASHKSGDRVLAQQRSDGAWLMSEANPKPAASEPPLIFADERGYINGRIFDAPDAEVGAVTWTFGKRLSDQTLEVWTLDDGSIDTSLPLRTSLSYMFSSRLVLTVAIPAGLFDSDLAATHLLELDVLKSSRPIYVRVERTCTIPPSNTVAYANGLLEGVTNDLPAVAQWNDVIVDDVEFQSLEQVQFQQQLSFAASFDQVGIFGQTFAQTWTHRFSFSREELP